MNVLRGWNKLSGRKSKKAKARAKSQRVSPIWWHWDPGDCCGALSQSYTILPWKRECSIKVCTRNVSSMLAIKKWRCIAMIGAVRWTITSNIMETSLNRALEGIQSCQQLKMDPKTVIILCLCHKEVHWHQKNLKWILTILDIRVHHHRHPVSILDRGVEDLSSTPEWLEALDESSDHHESEDFLPDIWQPQTSESSNQVLTSNSARSIPGIKHAAGGQFESLKKQRCPQFKISDDSWAKIRVGGSDSQIWPKVAKREMPERTDQKSQMGGTSTVVLWIGVEALWTLENITYPPMGKWKRMSKLSEGVQG